MNIAKKTVLVFSMALTIGLGLNASAQMACSVPGPGASGFSAVVEQCLDFDCISTTTCRLDAVWAEAKCAVEEGQEVSSLSEVLTFMGIDRIGPLLESKRGLSVCE